MDITKLIYIDKIKLHKKADHRSAFYKLFI